MARHLGSLDQGRLQRRITHTLRKQVRQWIPEHRVLVCCDLHLVPFAGRSKSEAAQLLKGQAKQGTNRFHGYSTACIAEPDRRLTFSCRAHRPGTPLVNTVQQCLLDIEALGIKVKWLLLDRGFYCYEVLAFLLKARVPFLMPLRVGRNMKAKWKPRRGSFKTTHMLQSEGRKLRLDVMVVKRYKMGRRGEHGVEDLCYAFGGGTLTPHAMRETYRLRFGIETAYRVAEAARSTHLKPQSSHPPTLHGYRSTA